MSRLYNTIKRYYDMGLYNEDQLRVFVQKKAITPAEYEQITGEAYEAPAPEPEPENVESLEGLPN